MEKQTEYKIEKQKNKQKLIRNEFLYHNQSHGEYYIPVIKKRKIDIEKIKFSSYMNIKKDDNDNKDKTIHFFTYDWKFKNVSGLNTKDLKFFDYDDPYIKDQMTKCSICGSVALQDQYGNGECKHCGWKFNKDERMFEQKWGISYPMLVSPTTAREQYKNGLPFKATFKEFVNGLYFYSEMLFEYNKTTYEVFLKKIIL